jgi:lipid-binding SYLF domain-containing protein
MIRRHPNEVQNDASALAVILLAGALASAGDPPDKKRKKTRKMADQTLQELYKLQPTAQAAIQKSAGYAVFNNMGTNLLQVSTVRGAVVAVNSNTKQETFMKMISAGAGLGIGVKDSRVIFVFENDKQASSILAGRVQHKLMLPRRPERRAQPTRERSRLPREFGFTRLPRMVLPSS